MISGSKASIGIAVVATGLAIFGTVAVARRERQEPARCAGGFSPSGPYCRVTQACPAGFVIVEDGCVMPSVRIRYAGGRLDLGASDWEAPNKDRRATVKPFELDSVEVTLARWRECEQAGHCAEVSTAGAGIPISDVSAEEAVAFCDFAGGRLPTGDEWMFAAGGEKGRRFAWGQTGLVCRRAAFGLADGPCARGADHPELAGARPDGRSPEGAYDLSGNVSEWAREADGSVRARGGSFRSRVAGELKTWSEEISEPATHVGFRCAYDLR